VELFTSQSCSSCPPADKVLRELSQREDVITLGCHVTYWNHLHWRDTLSLAECTGLQRDLAQAKGSHRVYTPQTVINGDQETVGSNRGTVQRMINRAAILPKIHISRSTSGFDFMLPAIKSGTYDLFVLEVGEVHTQSIPTGENRGRTVEYSSPVRSITALGEWDGKADSIMQEDFASKHSIVILARDKRGRIHAAGRL